MGLSQANVSRLNAILTQANNLHNNLVVELDRFVKATQAGEIQDERDVADGAYLCKQIYERLDYLRKDCERARKSASQVACERWVIKELGGLVKGPIHGQLTTATTKVDYTVVVPKKDTPEYFDLCVDMGVPPEVVTSDVFHIHWPGIVAECNRRLREGLPLPKGIDKHLTKVGKDLEFIEEKDFDLSFRKAKS